VLVIQVLYLFEHFSANFSSDTGFILFNSTLKRSDTYGIWIGSFNAMGLMNKFAQENGSPHLYFIQGEFPQLMELEITYKNNGRYMVRIPSLSPLSDIITRWC